MICQQKQIVISKFFLLPIIIIWSEFDGYFLTHAHYNTIPPFQTE